jgi:hypothetical protein
MTIGEVRDRGRREEGAWRGGTKRGTGEEKDLCGGGKNSVAGVLRCGLARQLGERYGSEKREQAAVIWDPGVDSERSRVSLSWWAGLKFARRLD